MRSQFATLALCAALAIAGPLSKQGSVVLESSGQLKYVEGQLVDGAIARGVYTDMEDRPVSMFGELTIRTSSMGGKANDSAQARAAGLLEGHLTATRMKQHYDNWNQWLVAQGIPHDNGTIPAKFYTWFGQQKSWSETQARENFGKDANWTLSHLVDQQFEGLMLGYNAEADADKQISPLDHWMIVQGMGDLLNLNTILDKDPRPVWERFDNTDDLLSWMRATSHCSGFVKANGDLSFLASAHVAWFTFSSMLRIFKHYEHDF